MSSQLENLKNSIKKEYTEIFELNLMKTSGFIPVDKRQSDFYVILSKSKASDKSKIEGIIKEKIKDLNPKFIPVEASEFEELLKVFSDGSSKERKTVAQDDVEDFSAEEMLVSAGWITRNQLDECIAEAKEKKLPLDALFYSKEYLSYERIVS